MIFEVCKFMSESIYEPIVSVINNSRDPHTELVKKAAKEGMETRVFECRGRFDRRLTRELRRYVLARNVALIHAHQYKANFYTLAASHRLDLAKVTTCHLYYNQVEGLAMKAYDWIDQRRLRNFDYIIATSGLVRDDVLGSGISTDKVAVVGNGVDLSRFEEKTGTVDVRQELGLSPDSRIVGTVGRLHPQKNHALLLKSAKRVIAKFSDVFFLIVGEGRLQAELKTLIRSLDLQGRVIMAGNRADIPDLLASMDLFVLTSLAEGLPMALLEAMASKLPVISTPVGGIPDVLQQDRSGLLVQPDPTLFSDAIIRLLDDPGAASRLAKSAYETVVAKHTNQAMANQYFDIYDQVLSREQKAS